MLWRWTRIWSLCPISEYDNITLKSIRIQIIVLLLKCKSISFQVGYYFSIYYLGYGIIPNGEPHDHSGHDHDHDHHHHHDDDTDDYDSEDYDSDDYEDVSDNQSEKGDPGDGEDTKDSEDADKRKKDDEDDGEPQAKKIKVGDA